VLYSIVSPVSPAYGILQSSLLLEVSSCQTRFSGLMAFQVSGELWDLSRGSGASTVGIGLASAGEAVRKDASQSS
jgi:hypothetical protein